MKIKCSYCGSLISDTDEVCPNCGAQNEGVARTADGVPKTIGELKSFCASHNMPLEKMRFFIGEDYKEPKAFGILKMKMATLLFTRTRLTVPVRYDIRARTRLMP